MLLMFSVLFVCVLYGFPPCVVMLLLIIVVVSFVFVCCLVLACCLFVLLFLLVLRNACSFACYLGFSHDVRVCLLCSSFL